MNIKLTIILISLFCLAPVTAKEYKIRWQINHTPMAYFVQAVEKFQDLVEKKSAGKLKVEAIYNSGISESKKALVLSKNLLRSVQSGEIEMAQVYTSDIASTYNERFHVFDLPYLFEGHDHAKKVFESKIGKNLLASLDNSGIKGLGFTYSGGFMVQLSNDKKINKFEDLKGTTYKTFNGKYTSEGLKYLMVNEIKETASQSKGLDYRTITHEGSVDHQSSTYSELGYLLNNDKKLNNKIVNETNHRLLMTTLVLNEKFFNSLPRDLQEVVKLAASEVAAFERANIITEAKRVKGELRNRGILILPLDLREKVRWKKQLNPLYQKFYSEVEDGRQLVNGINKV